MMKPIFAPVAIVLSASVVSIPGYAGDDLSNLKGPYLGQPTPGTTAEVFAPGLVSTEVWGDAISFSHDMKEIYIGRWRHSRDDETPDNAIYTRVGDGWQVEIVPSGSRKPSYSPDGKVLHYKAKYKERTADGWSEMKSLGQAFEEIEIMGLSASLKGTLILDEWTQDGSGILRYSQLVNGERSEPKPLPKEINAGMWNAHPFIAPDESYIMWDGERENGFGSSDLYISFRLDDGSWSEGVNLGDRVNTDSEEGGPQITPDGKFLFFNRMMQRAGSDERQSDLFWIDASFIEELRPNK